MIVPMNWIIQNRLFCLNSRNITEAIFRIPFESTFIYSRDIVPTFE